MTSTMRARKRASQFLLAMLLVVSNSKIITRAQEVTLNGGASNASSAELAASLSKAFAGLSLDLNELSTNGTAGLGSEVPNLAKLLNMTLAPGTSLQDALKTVTSQQQSLGGIGKLEEAAKVVATFLNLPLTVGSGQNIQAFLKEVQRYRELTNTVRTALNLDQVEQITGYLNTATTLALSALAAFPLAQLAYLTALIALGAAITGLIAGIFYLVGSALAIAAAVPAVAAIDQNKGKDTGTDTTGADTTGDVNNNPATGNLRSDQWFTNLKSKALKLQEPILRFAFSENSVLALQTADSVLGLTQTGLDQIKSIGTL